MSPFSDPALSAANQAPDSIREWTQEMRKASLKPAELKSADLDVVDVGGGTGFCTIGILEEGVKVASAAFADHVPLHGRCSF